MFELKFNTAGFTFIEILTVVVIVSVLTITSFVSYIGHIQESRNSQRVSELSTFYSGLGIIKQKEGMYPRPENPIKLIGAGSKTIGYQGSVGSTLLTKLNVTGGGRDAQLAKYYTFLENGSATKIQLLAFFENSGYQLKLGMLAEEAYAADNMKLFPATIGNKLGVLLSRSTHVPLHETANGSVILSTQAGLGNIDLVESCIGLGVVGLAAGNNTNYENCFSGSTQALPPGW